MTYCTLIVFRVSKYALFDLIIEFRQACNPRGTTRKFRTPTVLNFTSDAVDLRCLWSSNLNGPDVDIPELCDIWVWPQKRNGTLTIFASKNAL